MAKPSGDEVVKQNHKRIFRQPAGPGFGSAHAVRYAGKSDQYLAIQGASRAIVGGRDPINVPDPDRRLGFRKVGETVSAPGNNTFDLMVLHKHGSIPFTHSDLLCPQNFYVSVGQCKNPSDFSRGWSDYVRVFAYASPDGDVDEGDVTPAWDSDDASEETIPFVDVVRFSVGALNFGEKAGPQVDREVVGVVYGSNADCGVCGPRDDGTKRIYWVTKSSGGGSPGLPGEIIYTVDGCATFGEATITGLGATADPTGIEIISGKLVVIVGSEDAYYWADINTDTGIPGGFTKVTSGFAALSAGSPNDIYTPDGVTAYICGDAGYVYKLSSVGGSVEVLTAGTVTTNNLTRIDGDDLTTIVAVGGNGTIIISHNSGSTWGVSSSAPSVGTNILTALAVTDDNTYLIGSSTGYLYGTNTGGAAWEAVSFSGWGTGAIYDILDVGGGVLYLSHSNATPTARIFSTWNGGADWTNENPRINNLPTHSRANRLAAPRVSVQAHTIAANYLAIAGLAGNNVDGFLGLGAASIL